MTAPVRRGDEREGWSAAEAAVAMVAFGLAATAIATSATRPPSATALVAAAAFFLLVAGAYIAFGVGGVRGVLRAAVARLPDVGRLLAGPAVLFVAVAVYAVVTGLPLVPRLTAFGPYLLLLPLLLVRSPGPPAAPARELLVILALWLPIEWRLLPALPVPAPNGYDVRKLVGLVDAMYLFLIARPLSQVGYTYRLRASDAGAAVLAFLVYAAVALPIGFATGFLTWQPRLSAMRLLGAPLIIYLATGVPEEFLFRGLLQNFLTRWLGIRVALPLASIVFGLAHLPDPRYAVLAAIAGVAYGWVYQRTGKITASAITHAFVDAVWGALLGG